MIAGTSNSKQTKILLRLAILSGILLGISFPPNPYGVIVCFALVPLLIIFENTEGYRKPLWYSYITFLILQIISIYWMGGFVHAQHGLMMFAVVLLIVVHPLLFFIPILGYLVIRRTFGRVYALSALPLIWVGFEYLRSLGDLAFPWQTLGNTHTYDIVRAQFITFTGVYGLSFWIVVINALAFVLFRNIGTNRWRVFSYPSLSFAAGIIFIYLLPLWYGSNILSNQHATDEKINIGVVQPHVDPFEKWNDGRGAQIEQLLEQSRILIADSPDIIIFPETAVPFYLLHPVNRAYLGMLQDFVDETAIPILVGLPHAVFYDPEDKIPPTAKVIPQTEEYYASYNAAALITPEAVEYQWYGKIVLVPFVERIPFAELFNFAVLIRRQIGTGGWDIGPDTTIFNFERTIIDEADTITTPVHFGVVICYESVYPGLVRHFPRLGAEFLVVITNDSWWDRMDKRWWGRTPGPRQHAQMSVLRAIENRRSIARAANGGISSFIDPYGRILYETEFFVTTQTTFDIPLSRELTFYSKHGDVFAKLCLLLGALPVMASIGERMRKRIFAFQDKYRKEEND